MASSIQQAACAPPSFLGVRMMSSSVSARMIGPQSQLMVLAVEGLPQS
jgi:hypothetical protein